MNEAFRLNKEKLYAELNERNKQINIAIIYQKQEIQTYKIIEQKINLLLSRLIEELWVLFFPFFLGQLSRFTRK